MEDPSIRFDRLVGGGYATTLTLEDTVTPEAELPADGLAVISESRNVMQRVLIIGGIVLVGAVAAGVVVKRKKTIK